MSKTPTHSKAAEAKRAALKADRKEHNALKKSGKAVVSKPVPVPAAKPAAKVSVFKKK